MITVKARPYQLHVIRLLPGEDVRTSLEGWCSTHSIEAACVVSAVGSLTQAHLRYAGKDTGTLVRGDLEVCSLSGTLSRHGLHLHLAVSDAEGRMSGGHLLADSNVRTTLELVIHELGGVRMERRKDRDTGYLELFPVSVP